MESIVEDKIILPNEVERLRALKEKAPLHEYTWAPILWASKLIQRSRTEEKIKIEPPIFNNLISSLDYITTCNRNILNYGWINFPIKYTQVVTISVFLYFFIALFGRQYLEPPENHQDLETFDATSFITGKAPFNDHTPDLIFPIFTVVEFLCYMGWIKVAEGLLNPYGDDDEDFELGYIIYRNLQTSYLIVEEGEMQDEVEMVKDPFLEEGLSVPTELTGDTRGEVKKPLMSVVSDGV